MTPRKRGRSGGPGTAAGIDFQARLAAWFACAILAEQHAAPLWGWSEAQVYESVYAETGGAVDDLLVRNSAGCRGFVQAKFRVNLEQGEGSPLGKALSQFVRQFIDLDCSPNDCDRFVLATSTQASTRVRVQLPRILERVRVLHASEPLKNAARGTQEEEVLQTVNAHLARAWREATNREVSEDELRAILSAMRVTVHDLYNDGAQAREAVGWLRASILRNSSAAGGVWLQAISLASEFSVFQTGANRRWLQERLGQFGIELHAAPSFRSDIDKLVTHSRRNMDRIADFSVVRGDSGELIKLERETSDGLRNALRDGSVVVTGDPGAGKSASLFELTTLLQDTRDFVLLTSDTLAASSLGQLRDELGLDHDVVEVLQNWPGIQPGYLMIDALDAARGESTQEALLDLIGSVARSATRWRIAASIRRFDLRYNVALQSLFAATDPAASPEFQSKEFVGVRHFNVPLLSDTELAQLATLAPRLHGTLTSGTNELSELARVPFNLRLLADLVSLNVQAAELEPITTQLQLLEKYWEHRVLSRTGGDALETVLRATCNAMLASRSMRADRALLQHDPAYEVPINTLLSRRVLAEQERAEGVVREVLTFSHHVLFDYAVARLLFRGLESKIVDKTVEQPELVLIVRPSYELHFLHVWATAVDRQPFWSVAVALAAADEVPEIGKIVAPGVAAQQIRCREDIQPLIDSLHEASVRRPAAELVLRHVIGARLAEGETGDAIPDDRRDVWCEIAYALSDNTLRSETGYPLANLLQEICGKPEKLSGENLRNAGAAARTLFRWVRDSDNQNQQMVRFTIQAVARTFASETRESEELLRSVLEPDRIQKFGFLEIPELADEMPALIDMNPALARDIYIAAYDFEEKSNEPTSLRSGVMNLSSTRAQDYRRAYRALEEAFSCFVRRAPDAAIDALAAIQRAEKRGHSAF